MDNGIPFGYHMIGSPEGSSQRSMSSALFWSVIMAILLAEGAIIVSALRMHVDSDPARGLLGARAFEVVWTLLPLTLLALMVFFSYDAFQADRQGDAGASFVRIEV